MYSAEKLPRHRLTVADYYKMGEAGIFKEGDRVELIEGELIDMTLRTDFVSPAFDEGSRVDVAKLLKA